MNVWVTEHSCTTLSLQQQNLYYKYETSTKKKKKAVSVTDLRKTYWENIALSNA